MLLASEVAFCKRAHLPIEKVFTRALRDKFPWAMSAGGGRDSKQAPALTGLESARHSGHLGSCSELFFPFFGR